jgi:hypothetical protein
MSYRSVATEIGNFSRNKPGHGQKGQYMIIIEVVLIIVGILITSYTISIFTDVKTGTTSVAVKDNFGSVADQVLIGLVKVSTNQNAVGRVQIPGKIAETTYKISLDGGKNELTVASLSDSRINATRQIFNIGQVNRIIKSEVASSALVVEVISENGNIRIARGR